MYYIIDIHHRIVGAYHNSGEANANRFPGEIVMSRDAYMKMQKGLADRGRTLKAE